VITTPDRFERHIGISEYGYRREWVACDRCGCATNIFSSGCDSELAALESAYYEVDLKGLDMGERYSNLMALPADKSDNVQRVARVLHFLNNWRDGAYNVLDIGAGTGVFLSRLLDDAGAMISLAVGIEPDPMAALHLKSLGRFNVIPKAFPISEEVGTFSLITLNKVLEHMRDPVSFLRQITPHMKDELGILYVEVPDVQTAAHRPPSDNILGSMHRHLYTPEGLAIALRSASMLPIQINRFTEPSGKLSLCAFATTLSSSAIVAGH